MRARRLIQVVDSHTEGMPTRVIVGGTPPVPGATIAEQQVWALRHLGELRGLVVREPRGHDAMFGALLLPATRPDADFGVIFFNTTSTRPMCGHGIMGVATVLIETGMVAAVEPRTMVRLDTPAGLVTADLVVEKAHAKHVTLTNVPSYVHTRDLQIQLPGWGGVTVDVAYGGNFYAIVDIGQFGLPLDPKHRARLTDLGVELMAAVNEACSFGHPTDATVIDLRHVEFTAPATPDRRARNVVVAAPGYVDRSPCGTGTSARMALLHATGRLDIGDRFEHESIIGTRFIGQVAGTTTVREFPAIIPTITGRAWITATAQLVLDPNDPFPAGFLL
ncbi:proline racemase family protein [Nocardia sp. NPDC049190]|uniref:proline racemase family protein n=1 Tax=Nocardia sp. NPDC049190 TaxID=3155650 RepID=UPI00340F8022